MSEFLTTLPWGWYAAALVLASFGIYGAALYEALHAPDTYHDYCARVDDELTRPVLIGSGLDALMEDNEVAFLDSVFDLPAYGGKR